MKLSEILNEQSVRIPLQAQTKDEVLRELVALLPCASDAESRDRIHEAVVEREQRMSTGIGQGIAIPHGKCSCVDEMEVAFAIAAKPVDFDALDGLPVDVFFLLVSSPEQAGSRLPGNARSRTSKAMEWR